MIRTLNPKSGKYEVAPKPLTLEQRIAKIEAMLNITANPSK